jgi:hypothetical protein
MEINEDVGARIQVSQPTFENIFSEYGVDLDGTTHVAIVNFLLHNDGLRPGAGVQPDTLVLMDEDVQSLFTSSRQPSTVVSLSYEESLNLTRERS